MSKYLPLDIQFLIKEIKEHINEQQMSASDPNEEPPPIVDDAPAVDAPATPEAPTDPAMADPNAMDDMSGDLTGGEMDPGMGGIGGMDDLKSSKDIGRIYELKKIYSRLIAAQRILSDTQEPDLIKMKELVTKSIDFFDLVISNFASYKEQTDDIIIAYYKFIIKVYAKLRSKYKKASIDGEK